MRTIWAWLTRRPRLNGDIRIMRLRADDIVVLQVKEALSQQRAADVEAILAREFPDHKVIVLHGGWELSLVRPGQAAPGQHPGELETGWV